MAFRVATDMISAHVKDEILLARKVIGVCLQRML